MKARFITAIGLALVLTSAAIALGTLTPTGGGQGPYLAATANYGVATAEASQCANTYCAEPGTTNTTCFKTTNVHCVIYTDGTCHTLKCPIQP